MYDRRDARCVEDSTCSCGRTSDISERTVAVRPRGMLEAASSGASDSASFECVPSRRERLENWKQSGPGEHRDGLRCIVGRRSKGTTGFAGVISFVAVE